MMIKTPLVYQKNKKYHPREKKMFIKAIETVKKNNNTHYLRRLKVLQEDLHNAIEVSKLNYYSQITYKLTHIQKMQKFIGHY